MAKLIVKKEDGSLLFDTDKISYGLIKSGHLAYAGNWNRYVCTSKACLKDPSWGGNWSGRDYGDQIFSFSVVGAKSPIVFITGGGCLAGTQVVGDVKTFFYGGTASVATKFYCFDLMREGGEGPALRTYRDDRTLTFNSRQVPLNVFQAVMAPARGNEYSNYYIRGFYYTTYQGGYNRQVGEKVTSSVDVPILGAGEVAAFLPWSRSCSADIEDGFSYRMALTEGAFGGMGKITFQFAIASETTFGEIMPTSTPANPSVPYFRNIPVDRYPTALVIRTEGLPFPFSLS
ncbi:hypothetical protein [Pseudomonas sp. TWR3-1-1]|uniref:hypothetical protein n=1 Tax=Pseudomonas sp. TWR3-1-1 TaxID=2804633 RepID=UPI003CF784F0